MDPGPYPRPDSIPSGPYAKDKTWGIVVMALSSLGICCGLGVAGVGGMMGGAALSLASESAKTAGSDPASSAGDSVLAAFGGASALVVIFGIGLVVCSILQIVGGAGIMGSRRWGFVLTALFAGISILFHLPGLLHGTGVVGVAVHGVIAYYCWARLSGKEGPSPL